MDINKLENELDNSKTVKGLSNSFNNISRALNKACDNLFKELFDYKFSKYLYREYILRNKTKAEISEDLQLPQSTVFYYIKKYKLKKDSKSITQRRLQSIQKTCQERYGVDHPGQLESAHAKRITNIVNKTQGYYNKDSYPKLNRSEDTILKMKECQQLRRLLEKEDNDG